MSTRHMLSSLVNRILAPLGVEVRRRFSGGHRRVTMVGGLERIKSIGFVPATVLDVGVAAGTPALYETFPSARHILIEPLQEFAGDIARIVARLPRAEHVFAAAGAQNGETILNIASVSLLTSRNELLDRSYAGTERRRVPMVTLDEVWHSRHLEGPALLKIDVEGDELEVLRGAEEVLRASTYVILEGWVRDVFSNVPRVEALFRRMHEAGFRLEDIVELAYARDGYLQMADWIFRRD